MKPVFVGFSGEPGSCRAAREWWCCARCSGVGHRRRCTLLLVRLHCSRSDFLGLNRMGGPGLWPVTLYRAARDGTAGSVSAHAGNDRCRRRFAMDIEPGLQACQRARAVQGHALTGGRGRPALTAAPLACHYCRVEGEPTRDPCCEPSVRFGRLCVDQITEEEQRSTEERSCCGSHCLNAMNT